MQPVSLLRSAIPEIALAVDAALPQVLLERLVSLPPQVLAELALPPQVPSMPHVVDSVRALAAQGPCLYPTAAAKALEAVLSEQIVFAPPHKQSRNYSG